MNALLNFHHIAASRGDGLRSELKELLERRDAMATSPSIVNLADHSDSGFTQSGPNPIGNAASGAAPNVRPLSLLPQTIELGHEIRARRR